MIKAISYLPLLKTGRTFVCGDIHGCFSLLETNLAEVQFDEENDRVICVGDLIDRGPESHRALEFLAKPWFYSVLGNHEQMLLDMLSGDQTVAAARLCDGGSWFYEQVSETARDEWQKQLSQLPILIEVETEKGIVGIMHADLPKRISWQQFVGLVQESNPSVLSKAIMGRSRVCGRYCEDVRGVWRIFCGHTVITKSRLQGNVYCIDTGAYLGTGKGELTLLDVLHDC